MDHLEAGRFWNENADVWTRLARSGVDLYRDHLNTPAFLSALPDVRGLAGLDLGCGEGHNTRLVAARGARMTAVDIADVFVGHAQSTEVERPMGIDYRVASAVDLPFEDCSFDFVVAFMSLMEFPETDRALGEALRVLRPGGFLQFSIEHPCYATPHRRNLRDSNGVTYAIEVGGYFSRRHGEIEEWIFGAAPAHVKEGLRKFRIPRFPRPLHEWINLLVAAGFTIEWAGEPAPSDDTVCELPYLQDAQVVPYFLHLRVRKARPPGR